MDEKRTVLQRYGAHIGLILGAILLFIVASIVPFEEVLDFQVVGERSDGSERNEMCPTARAKARPSAGGCSGL